MDFTHTEWEHQKSIVPAKREELERIFNGWGQSAQGLVEVCFDD